MENLVLPEALQQQRIKERRVDFELTTAQAAALKKSGASDTVIEMVKQFRRPAVVQITCKPVDCAVLVNEQQRGQTTNGVLRLELPVGPAGVEVQAANYHSAVAVLILEANAVKEKTFVLEPLAPPIGAVALTCEAGLGECEIGIDDRAVQTTTRKSIRFADLPAGPHRVVAHADGFLENSRDITVKGGATETLTVKLDPIPEIDAAPFLDEIVSALGGLANVARAQKLGGQGIATITTDIDRRMTQAPFVESVKLPFVRWDMLIDGEQWSTGTTETGTWSDGNQKLKNLPAALELPQALRLFKVTRITDLVWFKNSIYKMRVVNSAGNRTLILEGKEDRYSVAFDKDPMRATIIWETIGGTLKSEVTYEKFSKVSEIMLPYRVTIKFPGFKQVMDYQYYFTSDELHPREFFAERKAGFNKVVEITKDAAVELKGVSNQK